MSRSSAIDAEDEIEICRSVDELRGWRGRMAAGLVLRSYLDAYWLTPLELMCWGQHLKQFLNRGETVEGALTRAAQAQTRQGGEVASARKAALRKLVDQCAERTARATQALAELPRRSSAVQSWLEASPAQASRPGHLDVLRAAVCRDLLTVRGLAAKWDAKFDTLGQLLSDRQDPSVQAVVDEVVADLVLTPPALDELLGTCSSRGEALLRLGLLVSGRLSGGGSSPPSRYATQLNGQLQAGRLPVARAAALDLLARGLRSAEPLAQSNPDQEADLLRRLLVGLVTPEGVTGGGAMAEALTLRYARLKDGHQGGRPGFQRAVRRITEALGTMAKGAAYLATIASTPVGGRHQEVIVECTNAMLDDDAVMCALLSQSGSSEALKATLTKAAAMIGDCTGLAQDQSQALAHRIGHILNEHAISGKLFEWVEQTERGPTRQVLALTQLAAARVVRSAPAMLALHRRLLELLQAPELQVLLKPSAGGKGSEAHAAARQQLLDLMARLQVMSDQFGGGGNRDVQGRKPIDGAPEADEVAAKGSAPSPPSSPDEPAAAGDPMAGDPMAGDPMAGDPMAGDPMKGVFEGADDATVITDPGRGAVPVGRRAEEPGQESGCDTIAVTELSNGSKPLSLIYEAVSMTVGDDGPPEEQSRCQNCFDLKSSEPVCPHCGYGGDRPRRSGSHLTPGSRLHGRYQVGKILGQGGFGATYLGWDELLHVKVAVKEYFPASLCSRVPGEGKLVPFTDDQAEAFEAGIGKFLEEARILARLREIKEIVSVQDFFEENHTAYMVMDLLTGETFKKFITDHGGKLSHKLALITLAPVMRAMHTVHQLGLIHRDISPNNIFVTNLGETRLIDFGAARQAATVAPHAFTVMLKLGYSPPEQYLQHSRQGPWSDVYAMAATLYCGLTGRPPMDAISRLQTDTLLPPSAAGAQVPPAFERVVMAALEIDWQKRPQSMKALLAQLEQGAE